MAKGYKSRVAVNAARQALNRASKVLGKRGSGLMAPPRSGGYYGNYNQFTRGLVGRSYGGYSRGGPELKYIDTSILNSSPTSSGTTTLLNGVSQGTDYTNRIGRKIIVKSILANFRIYPNTAATTLSAGDHVRFLCVYDTQTNSATIATASDILASGDINSPMNLNNRDRFHVIFDKRVTMNPAVYAAGALTVGAPTNKWFGKYKKCMKDVIFSGTGATIGSIQTGAIILLALSTQTSQTSFDCYFRFRFHDS